jgi:hypothetical protein
VLDPSNKSSPQVCTKSLENNSAPQFNSVKLSSNGVKVYSMSAEGMGDPS